MDMRSDIWLAADKRLPAVHPVVLRRLRCAIVGFGSILAMVASPDANAQQKQVTQVMNLTVQNGKSISLGSGFWSMNDDTCEFVSLRTETTIAPRLGRLAARMISGTVPSTSAGGEPNPVCVGRPIKALRLTYTANKGVRGIDRVLVRAMQDKLNPTVFDFDFNITVE